MYEESETSEGEIYSPSRQSLPINNKGGNSPQNHGGDDEARPYLTPRTNANQRGKARLTVDDQGGDDEPRPNPRGHVNQRGKARLTVDDYNESEEDDRRRSGEYYTPDRNNQNYNRHHDQNVHSKSPPSGRGFTESGPERERDGRHQNHRVPNRDARASMMLVGVGQPTHNPRASIMMERALPIIKEQTKPKEVVFTPETTTGRVCDIFIGVQLSD